MMGFDENSENMFPAPTDELIQGVRNGDADATEQLFLRFYPLLRGLADRRLSKWQRSAVDGSEIAQSVVRTFFRRMTTGELTAPQGEGQLLVLLTRILARKLTRSRRYLGAQKRQPQTRAGKPAPFAQENLDEQELSQPQPQDELICQELLDSLLSSADEITSQIILLRLDGVENEQIAERLQISTRTVQRRLAATRAEWERLHLAEDD